MYLKATALYINLSYLVLSTFVIMLRYINYNIVLKLSSLRDIIP